MEQNENRDTANRQVVPELDESMKIALKGAARAVEDVATQIGQAAARKVTICVDADGGDDAPSVVTDGVILALAEDPALNIILVGREESVAKIAEEFPGRVETVITTEIIGMADHPAQAVRTKKDSSIVVGCKIVHEGRAQGFFSAGSTGACLTAATVLMGRIKGVARPALATIVPSFTGPVVFTDIGANSDCKAEYLPQFAIMGKAYSETFLGIENPTVGLLSNGSEDTKGSDFSQEVHALMAEGVPGFHGNVEGGDLMKGTCNVVVTDGFTGNVALKVIEGTAGFVFANLKKIMMASLPNKVAGATLKGDLKAFKDTIDPDVYGGAPLLGVRGVCVIGHGSSGPEAIKNGIAACAKSVRDRLPERIAEALS